MADVVRDALEILDLHYEAFYGVEAFASRTGHPVPMDTRGWSQVLVSSLTGLRGLDRRKGADLIDGSDVKGANTWSAIDTPRFNGVLKAGTRAANAGRLESLDETPNLYLTLWDETARGTHRCRIWAVNCREDPAFRGVAAEWFRRRQTGDIRSDNFQLHPPRGRDSNEIRNLCGNLRYPLFFAAERIDSSGFRMTHFDPAAPLTGRCYPVA